MSFFERLFGKKPTSGRPPDVNPSGGQQEAVLVHLDGRGLPDHVYEECDLATIEDRLAEAMATDHLGELDGNEIGPAETTLFLYGPDAERLFAGIEPILRAYPLCQGARVEIRRGGPGAEAREVRL